MKRSSKSTLYECIQRRRTSMLHMEERKSSVLLVEKRFSMAYDKKIYEADLPHRAVAVYLYLKDRANKEGTCYPAIGTIVRELHLSVSTVKRAISDLEENGFIRKKQRWRDNGGRSSLLFEIIR